MKKINLSYCKPGLPYQTPLSKKSRLSDLTSKISRFSKNHGIFANSTMVEEQRQRIEQEMTKMVNELDLQYLRKMQADMHRCAAKCCDNRDISLESVQKCVESCASPLNYAQNYVQKELEQLQNKLQRCVMDCNDEIRVKMGPNPTESEVAKYTALFESCAKNCVDKQVSYMPSLLKRMKSELGRNQ